MSPYRLALEALYRRRRFGVRPGLETIRALLRTLGNPEQRLSVVHIAGSNGKGSTAAFVERIFRQGGVTTGLYTSPHLCRFTERIRLGGNPVDSADAARWLTEVDRCAPEDATFFEIVTAAALSILAEHRVQVAVIEVGLGGRLDATNVFPSPLATVITGIALEHTEVLGNTLAQIAREKAGILKCGRPAILAACAPEAAAVLDEVAHAVSAPAIIEGRNFRHEQRHDQFYYSSGDQVITSKLGLLGDHQAKNAALAIAAVRATGIPVTDEAIARGLAQTMWPGRLERIGNDVLIDAAHNPDGACALAASLPALANGRPVTLIFGVSEDKDAGAMLKALSPACHRVFLVGADSPRARDPRTLVPLATVAGLPSEVFPDFRRALARVGEDLAVIAGSIFLVGPARAHLTGEPYGEEGLLQDPAPTPI